MKPPANFSTTSAAGLVLALVLTTGAAHSFSCIGCELTASYHAAARIYDKARDWSLIARWWIAPVYTPAVRNEQPPPKPDNVCEMRSTVTAK